MRYPGVVSGRFELTEAEYAVVAPFLPATTPRRGGRWRDHRQVINGILFRDRGAVAGRAGAVRAVGDVV